LNNRKLFPKQTIIAVDGIAILVNPANPIKEVSLMQLKQIFRGETLIGMNYPGMENLMKLRLYLTTGNPVF